MTFNWMRGLNCSEVGAPSEHTTTFQFGAVTLAVESLWRIRVEGRIRRTSNDNGQRFGLDEPVDAAAEAFRLLQGRRILGVRVDDMCADLVVAFDNDVSLEIITDSAGYEAWTLSGTGHELIAGSGGTVHDVSRLRPNER